MQLTTSEPDRCIPLYWSRRGGPHSKLIAMVGMAWVVMHQKRLRLVMSRKQKLLRVYERPGIREQLGQKMLHGGSRQHFVQHLSQGERCYALKGVRGS